MSNKRSRGLGEIDVSQFPRLLGGSLCLDYVNTVEAPLGTRPLDYLAEYAHLVRWARYAGALDQATSDELIAAAAARPEAAATAFAEAVALRTTIAHLFGRIAHGEQPLSADLRALRAAYSTALRAAELLWDQGGIRWSWTRASRYLSSPMHPIAVSAIDLLSRGQPDRIRECPGAADCGWLFYDDSRNGRRRWCSMEGCGSRVKMRRQYARRSRAKSQAAAVNAVVQTARRA
jgi:predicted RNA-binding Zn ribbon-like protein